MDHVLFIFLIKYSSAHSTVEKVNHPLPALNPSADGFLFNLANTLQMFYLPQEDEYSTYCV